MRGPLPAGSPPAVPKLASAPATRSQSHRKSSHATRRPPIHADVLTLALRQTDRSNRRDHRSCCLTPRPNPHSARRTSAAHVPRFRALALFGRRPPVRVDGLVIPASENLHISGHPKLRRRTEKALAARIARC